MRVITRAVITAMFFCLALNATAQAVDNDKVNPEDMPISMNEPTMEPRVKVTRVLDKQGDSIQCVQLNRVYVYPAIAFKDEKQQQQYNQLVKNVKRVLPIAKEVNGIIIETYEYLQTLPNKKAKDQHMKKVEEAIKKQYTPRMKKLTFSQGKLLIKLIHRECRLLSGFRLGFRRITDKKIRPQRQGSSYREGRAYGRGRPIITLLYNYY